MIDLLKISSCYYLGLTCLFCTILAYIFPCLWVYHDSIPWYAHHHMIPVKIFNLFPQYIPQSLVYYIPNNIPSLLNITWFLSSTPSSCIVFVSWVPRCFLRVPRLFSGLSQGGTASAFRGQAAGQRQGLPQPGTDLREKWRCFFGMGWTYIHIYVYIYIYPKFQSIHIYMRYRTSHILYR